MMASTNQVPKTKGIKDKYLLLIITYYFFRYSKLVFISNKDARKSLADLLGKDDICEADLTSLLTQVTECCPSLCPALNRFLINKDIPGHWRSLLLDLSKSSIVNGLAQTDPDLLEGIWDEMGNQILDDHLATLSNIFPALLKFIRMSDPGDYELVNPIVREVLSCLRYVHEQQAHLLSTDVQHEPDTSGSFPSLPVIRVRGDYAMDKKQPPVSCKKLAKGHKSLLPGIFLVHCEHGMYSMRFTHKHLFI